MKAIIIKHEGKPIMIFEVREYTDLEFLKLKKECEKNLDELKESEIEKIQDIYNEIDKITDDIKHLKGED